MHNYFLEEMLLVYVESLGCSLDHLHSVSMLSSPHILVLVCRQPLC